MACRSAAFVSVGKGVLLAFFVSLCVFSTAVASSNDGKFVLRPGGHTIAGPGIAKISPNSSVDVVKLPDSPTRVCVTGHNLGSGTASLRIGPGPNGGATVDKLVKPKQSRAVCGIGTQVAIVCAVEKCRVNWRVDAF